MRHIIGVTALEVAFLLSPVAIAQPQAEWSEGEHLELGDKGALLACKELGMSASHCPVKNIPRADNKVLFTYGEVLVVADYYNSPQEMNQDKLTGIRNILRCAKRMLDEHPHHHPSEGEYSGCEVTGFFNIPGYLEVISGNIDHFGWHNTKAYVRYHQQALDRAKAAYLVKKSNPKKAKQLLAQALILNGFADHYLTDAFASGHVRTPRLQIKEWAAKRLSGLFKGTRADLLAVVLHDIESRDLKSGREQGLAVENSLGNAWLTRGDQHLRVDQDNNDPVFALPLAAVKASFKDLLIAWQTGVVVDGVFPALEYVPFSTDISLAEKLTPEYQRMSQGELFRSLADALPSMLSWLFSRSDFAKMQRDLPSIFASFRRAIAKDLSEHPEYRERMPGRYVQAYLETE